jgi:hypothetical protein
VESILLLTVLLFFVALPLFFGKLSCHFEYDIIILGHQRVEIAENWEGFAANTKRKFLSLLIGQSFLEITLL